LNDSSSKAGTIFGLGILVALVLLAFLIWPMIEEPPDDLTGVTTAVEEQARATQYQLGRQYEANGDYERAQDQYEEAALSAQEEISAASQTALARVIDQASRPVWILQTHLRSFLLTLFKLFFSLLITIVLITLLIGFIWPFFARSRRSVDVLLFPVKDYTADELGKGWHLLVVDILNETIARHEGAHDLLLTKFDSHDLPQFLVSPEPNARLSLAADTFDGISIGGFTIKFKPLIRLYLAASVRYRYLVQARMLAQGPRLRLNVLINEDPETMPTAEIYVGDPELLLADQAGEMAEQLAFFLLASHAPGATGTGNSEALRKFSFALQKQLQFAGEESDSALLIQAEEALQEALEIEPRYAQALYLLGVTQRLRFEQQTAVETLKSLLEPGQEWQSEAAYQTGIAHSQLFELYHKEFNAGEAETAFKTAADQIAARDGSARNTLLQALVYCELARLDALRMRDLPDQGRNTLLARINDQLDRALQVSEDKAVRSTAAYIRGLAYAAVGEDEKARAAYQEALHIDPAFAPACVAFAQTYLPVSADGEIWLRRAVAADPNYEYARLLLGQHLHRAAGESDEAALLRTEAKIHLRRAVHSAEAQNQLGEILYKEGDYAGAMAAFQAAVTLNKRKDVAWQNMAWRTLDAIENGQIALDKDLVQQAVVWAHKAVNLTEGTEKAWRALDTWGRALLAQGRYDQAEQVFRKSLGSPGGDRRLQNRYHLAQALVGRGNKTAASAVLVEALALKGSQAPWREKAEILQEHLAEQ
jgi:tetratricopeptide (TPR) repeat protein